MERSGKLGMAKIPTTKLQPIRPKTEKKIFLSTLEPFSIAKFYMPSSCLFISALPTLRKKYQNWQIASIFPPLLSFPLLSPTFSFTTPNLTVRRSFSFTSPPVAFYFCHRQRKKKAKGARTRLPFFCAGTLNKRSTSTIEKASVQRTKPPLI
ncbi:hypothetical protein BGX38DRAFT_516987 [Terfezia claveryi]|nr:hypothetical protein BGX38DRAFT_516987 [Terfezia claveryi]